MEGIRVLIVLGIFVLVTSKSVKQSLSSITSNLHYQEDTQKTLYVRVFDDENPKTKKFELFTTEVPWEDALIKCKERHSDLATIRSKEEDDLVLKLFKNKYAPYTKSIWIGGTRLDSEKGFFWMTDGEPIDEIATNWLPGEPNDKQGKEKCVSYAWGALNVGPAGWNDLDCTTSLPYICEYY
ncbi:hypothetical protein GE061_014887 [Apolygus lucorum]|uniref:C-type lectin domain-containing protein n=1 Tax=Apolygus lucorum TaxID=248454 RepID=A0A8S9XJH6_APOLU|nr:hypothetical protein GE061_014887 [Apolygus lucorum]